MRSVLEHLSDNDEVGIVGAGQSNRRPWGDRDSEGYVEGPHLALRAAGIDLTILAIASATGAVHGAAGTRSVVTVAEELKKNDWVLGELRLIAHDHGEPTQSNTAVLRRGHATIVSNAPSGIVATFNGGFSFNTTTDTVYWPKHGRPDGSQIVFTTSGTLPGLTPNRVYWVRDATVDNFKVSDTPWGAAINLAGGSGVHLAAARPCLVVQWVSDCMTPTAGITFSIGTPGVVNHTAHEFPEGTMVTFGSGTGLPPEVTAAVPYFVVAPTANSYNLSATLGGAAIAFSGAGGATQVTPHMMPFVAGYAHLRDRFNTYDNVLVVTPFQPIEPSDYPAGVPVVPGITLQPDVTAFSDLGLALPFAWNEGIEGFGVVGTATVAGLVLTLQGGQTIPASVFADGFVRIADSKAEIASNTTTTITVKAWVGGQPAAATQFPYHAHLPHWRNNPHHYTAGEGFLYPSDDMQPGGISLGGIYSDGIIYSRPRGRFVGSYVTRSSFTPFSSLVVSASGWMRAQTTGSAQMTVALGTGPDAGTLKVAWVTATNDPAASVQFEQFARAGFVVQLSGMGQTPSVDGLWRVVRMKHATATGSELYLTPYDPNVLALPGAVSGTVPASAIVARVTWKTVHKMGHQVESSWRIANAIGRRVVVASLGVNSSSQVLRRGNADYGYQGRIGWWDDDTQFNWTPSDPTGLAVRFRRLVTFIAPRAVKATLGAAKSWKVFFGDVWQGESEAIFSAAQRDLAIRLFPTFVSWLRGVIESAGLSPYPKGAQVPIQWAQITHDPWELPSLPVSSTSYSGNVVGDVEGKVNKSLARMAALSGGFTSSIDPNGSPKVSTDSAHYNGVGMVRNGKLVADVAVPMMEFALAFGLGESAIDVANAALTLIGEPANVTSLDPPNAATQARECARLLPEARRLVLQAHTWSFATKRTALLPIDSATTTWAYAYGVPADLVKVAKILDPNAPDDVQMKAQAPSSRPFPYAKAVETLPATQPYRVETEDGYRVLRTNQPDAVCVYTSGTVDFDLWYPLAREACVFYLAHLLVSGAIKGKTGAAAAESYLQMAQYKIAQAAGDDSEFQSDTRPEVPVPWLP